MATRRCTRDDAVGDQGSRPSRRDESGDPAERGPRRRDGALFNAIMAYVYAAGGPAAIDPFSLLDLLALRTGASEAERKAARSALEALATLRSRLATGGLGPLLRELINANPIDRPYPGLVIRREFRYLEA